ncbi:MAG: hypothetical protein PHF17_04780 [Arcobacteraceae bacterium]|jgi:hypothetical protein|nr:hypothetical protein [Arcobacteraceae bacterium]
MALGFGNSVKSMFNFNNVWLKKRKFDPELLDINDIKLPLYFKNIDSPHVMSEIKVELKTYKSLGYRFRKINELETKEYHSLQMGILLKALSLNIDLKVSANQDYFPDFIYDIGYTTVQSRVSEVIKRYDNEVSKISTEEELKSNLMWTPLEIGYLLFYLSFYQTGPAEVVEE